MRAAGCCNSADGQTRRGLLDSCSVFSFKRGPRSGDACVYIPNTDKATVDYMLSIEHNELVGCRYYGSREVSGWVGA